jgi:septal ring-binding cell division protein DamX
MNEIPVTTRTQRRFERRQMVFMGILALAIAVTSFFLGVMVGERGSFSGSKAEPPRLPMVQVAPPPLPASVPAGPQKLTFYDDLPKGNSAPLGSGINLPKGGYAYSPPPPPPVAPAASAAVAPAPAPVPAAPVVKTPAAAPPAAPAAEKIAAPKASAGGAYVVQVAATRDQAEAKRLIDKLKGKGFAATSERADLGAKGIWFRVTTGPYSDQATAANAAGQLKQQGFSAIARKR